MHGNILGSAWLVCSDTFEDPCSCQATTCVTSDNHTHITQLELTMTGLKGALNDDIFEALQYLSVVDFSNNFVSLYFEKFGVLG